MTAPGPRPRKLTVVECVALGFVFVCLHTADSLNVAHIKPSAFL